MLNFFCYLLFRREMTPRRVLVFRTGSIGDSICAFPALAAIRNHYQQAVIHILTNSGGNSLISLKALLDTAQFDEVIDYSSSDLLTLRNIIKKNKYDLVIELPQDQVSFITELRNLFFFRLAGIASGWGWQINTCFTFRQTQERNLVFVSETQRLLLILNSHGITLPLHNEYPLNIRNVDRQYAEMLLAEAFPSNADQKIVALVPGAKRVQNRYPVDRFVELAQWLTAMNYKVIVIGGVEDVENGRKLVVNKNVVSFSGLTTPVVSAVMISKCQVCISNDTGPMHLSYAVGTPVIGLFSSRDFQNKWFPPKGNIAIRNNQVHCSLCFSETCTNNICMQEIPLEEVKAAFFKIEKIKNEKQ